MLTTGKRALKQYHDTDYDSRYGIPTAAENPTQGIEELLKGMKAQGKFDKQYSQMLKKHLDGMIQNAGKQQKK